MVKKDHHTPSAPGKAGIAEHKQAKEDRTTRADTSPLAPRNAKVPLHVVLAPLFQYSDAEELAADDSVSPNPYQVAGRPDVRLIAVSRIRGLQYTEPVRQRSLVSSRNEWPGIYPQAKTSVCDCDIGVTI